MEQVNFNKLQQKVIPYNDVFNIRYKNDVMYCEL